MKVKGTDEILGGYNPVGWDKPTNNIYDYKSCNDSFIFSLKNGIIQNSILSRVKHQKYAICCNPNDGPNFTGGLMMKSNFNQNTACFSYQSTYEISIRSTSSYVSCMSYFSIEEYEVFQIHKKAL